MGEPRRHGAGRARRDRGRPARSAGLHDHARGRRGRRDARRASTSSRCCSARGEDPMSIEIYVAHVVEDEASLTIVYNGRWLQINGARDRLDAGAARRTTPRRSSSRSSTGSRRSSSPSCRPTPSPTCASASARRTAIPGASAATSSRPSPASEHGRSRYVDGPESSAGSSDGPGANHSGIVSVPSGSSRDAVRRPALRVRRALPDPLLARVGVVEADRLQQRLAVVRAGVAARAEQAAGVPDEPLPGIASMSSPKRSSRVDAPMLLRVSSSGSIRRYRSETSSGPASL